MRFTPTAVDLVDGPLTVTACSAADHACGQYSKCNVRDPLWRIKDRILAALGMCSIYEMATDTVPDMVPVSLTRRSPRESPVTSTLLRS